MEDNDHNRVAFLNVRLGEAKQRTKPRKIPRPKDGEINLRDQDCDPDAQKLLNKTRAAEWQNG